MVVVRIALIVIMSATIGAAPVALSEARAAGVLLGIMGSARPEALSRLEYSVERQTAVLPLPCGPTRAHRYRPVGLPDAPPVVLFPGVHPEGIDEARLIAFARSMARSGVDVLTPALPELAHFQVTEATLPRIVESTRFHARQTGRRAAGVVGISFAGGLALVAASQPQPAWAAFVVTVGSHHDLRRLARYYAGQPIARPDGTPHPHAAHPYGARVLIHAHAEHFFPPADVDTARELLGLWLAGESQEARAGLGRLGPSARTAMGEVLDWNNPAPLSEALLAAIEDEQAALLAASPAGRLAQVQVPVFVVHGEGDPVIPSSESLWLLHELPKERIAQGLITPVLRHAEVPETPEPAAYLEIVHFMGNILRAAQAIERSG